MRTIVFLGNCQIFWLQDAYRRFVASEARDEVTYIDLNAVLSEDDRTLIQSADLVVQQRLEYDLAVDLSGLTLRGERQEFPLVTANFLWPYAGRPHPLNAAAPGLRFGPYPDELGDTFLNRMIADGVAPEIAVDAYMAFDLAAEAQLERRYQIAMDWQRQRDEITGYRFADLIEHSFRNEHIFVTPHHPGLTVYRSMVGQFLTRMEVDRDRVAQMLRRIRGSPYGPDALPIHPAVGRYFGIKFATESYRYEQRPEGRFTFREYAERYVRFIWNPPLAAGIAAFHLGDLDTARAQVAEGLRRSPGSADGHATMSHILAADGQIEQAVAEARTATELEPAAVRLHVHLGQVLDRLGNGSEAEYAFERAIALAPEDPAGHIALSHLMFHQRRFDEALEAALRAIELEPEVADFHAHLGHIYAWREQPREAIGAMRTASELAPDRAAYHDWLSDLLERAGDRDGAIISARAAIALGASDHGRQQRLDRLCAAEPA